MELILCLALEEHTGLTIAAFRANQEPTVLTWRQRTAMNATKAPLLLRPAAKSATRVRRCGIQSMA